jgi:hypothetical protein
MPARNQLNDSNSTDRFRRPGPTSPTLGYPSDSEESIKTISRRSSLNSNHSNRSNTRSRYSSSPPQNSSPFNPDQHEHSISIYPDDAEAQSYQQPQPSRQYNKSKSTFPFPSIERRPSTTPTSRISLTGDVTWGSVMERKQIGTRSRVSRICWCLVALLATAGSFALLTERSILVGELSLRDCAKERH